MKEVTIISKNTTRGTQTTVAPGRYYPNPDAVANTIIATMEANGTFARQDMDHHDREEVADLTWSLWYDNRSPSAGEDVCGYAEIGDRFQIDVTICGTPAGEMWMHSPQENEPPVIIVDQRGDDYGDSEAPWATLCNIHGEAMGHDTRDLARRFAPAPDEWCEGCAEAKERALLAGPERFNPDTWTSWERMPGAYDDGTIMYQPRLIHYPSRNR